MTSRQQHRIDQLTQQLAAAREDAAELRGRQAGERNAMQTIAAQLAERAAAVGIEHGSQLAAGLRARADAVTLRRATAEHIVVLRNNASDPDTAAMALIDRLMVRGVTLTAELERAEADHRLRAEKDAGPPVVTAAAVAEPPVTDVEFVPEPVSN